MFSRMLTVIICATTLAAGETLSAEDRDHRSKALLSAATKLDDAFVSRDQETIRKYCVSNHISLTVRYQFFGLDKQLKTLDKLRLTSNEAGPKTVTWVTADVAQVRYEANLVGTYAGKRIDSTVQILTTWTLRNGRWIQISYQETPLIE